MSARARLEATLARLLLRLPSPVRGLVAGPPRRLDGLTLDGQIQLLLRLQRWARQPPWDALPLANARAQLDQEGNTLAAKVTGVDQQSLQLSGPAGPIPARIYRPYAAATPLPCLLFLHGGGFVLGSLDSHRGPCRALAKGAGCAVLAIDYRLAPEHPFPAGVEDSLSAFRSLATKATSWGLDPTRLAIGGDSAGGNLAAVVTQLVRADAVKPCLQLLWYPVTDFSEARPSRQWFGQGFYLERSMMDWCERHYLDDPGQATDLLASPLLGELAGVAPASVFTAGFDPLRDEGEAYAHKLRAAGVPTQQRRYPGLIHGFLNMYGSIDAAAVALDEACAALREAFRQHPQS